MVFEITNFITENILLTDPTGYLPIFLLYLKFNLNANLQNIILKIVLRIRRIMMAIINGFVEKQNDQYDIYFLIQIQKKKKQFNYFVYIKSLKNAYSITVTSSLTKNSTFSSSTFLRSESNSSVSISVIKRTRYYFRF